MHDSPVPNLINKQETLCQKNKNKIRGITTYKWIGRSSSVVSIFSQLNALRYLGLTKEATPVP